MLVFQECIQDFLDLFSSISTAWIKAKEDKKMWKNLKGGFEESYKNFSCHIMVSKGFLKSLLIPFVHSQCLFSLPLEFDMNAFFHPWLKYWSEHFKKKNSLDDLFLNNMPEQSKFKLMENAKSIKLNKGIFVILKGHTKNITVLKVR